MFRRACVVVGLLTAVFCAAAPGAPLVLEDFESYTVGDPLHALDGPGGWIGAWNVPVTDRRPEVTVVGSGLGYAAGNVRVDGGSQAMQYLATEDGIAVLATRQMPASSADVLYMSFLYQNSANNDASGGDDFVQVGFRNTAGEPLLSGMEKDNLMQVRSGTSGAGSTASSGIGSVTGATYFMVLRAEKTGGSSTYDQLDLFVNPVSATEALNPFTTAAFDSGVDLSSGAFASIRKAFWDSGDAILYDEIRVGETFADVVPAGPGNRYVLPDFLGRGADAYVHSGTNADGNFGTSGVLNLKATDSADAKRMSYLRFDLAEAPWPGYTDASLTLTIAGGNLGNETTDKDWMFEVFGLNDGLAGNASILGEDWGETDITWNNAPGNDTGSSSVNLDDVFAGQALATFTIQGRGEAGDVVTLDGETFPLLVDFLNSDTDGLATFIVTRVTPEFSGENVVHQLFSKEAAGSLAPYLTLGVPEPSTLSLSGLGLAGMLLLGVRRRGPRRR